jgi:tetratricopeptide (TPR) repeat protein
MTAPTRSFATMKSHFHQGSTRYLSSQRSGFKSLNQTCCSPSKSGTVFSKPSSRHLSSTSSSGATETAGGLAFSKSSLGLEKSFVRPVLDSIRQLPEVNSAWGKFSKESAVDDLKRASDVFASFAKGGPEHMAVLALLAECQQRLALYEDSLQTLEGLGAHAQASTIPYGTDDMTLAQAKVFWKMGEFGQSQALCETMIKEYDDFNENFPSTNLHMASAMSGKALSQLAAMNTLDDAFSVRDYFRIAVKFLERNPPSENELPRAAVDLNDGVAEAVYAIFLEKTNDVDVPMDPALRSWFKGLQKTQSERPLAPHLKAASHSLKASIQANLGWGVLNYEQDRSDRLKKASGYAGDALAIYDADGILGAEGMCRVLSVIASCYHQAGSAVTAEGLFQSATDRKKLPTGPLPLLELRDACSLYAGLCKQWDKREGDVQKLESRVDEIEASLPQAWQGSKPGVLASAWFWTPGDFK